MLNCQNSIINHLKRGFQTPVIRTIKDYAGELQDANRLTQLLPAVLVMYIDGLPTAEQKEFEFDLITVVQNSTLEKILAYETNLGLASEVTKYLRENYLITAWGRNGSYETNRETLRARTVLNDARFNIIAIKIFLKDYTK